MSEGSAAAEAVLRHAIGALCGLLALLVWIWWLHNENGPRVMTRELSVYAVVFGLVGLFLDAGTGLALVALGVGLWLAANRMARRPLDDRPVMGRGTGGDDADDDE